MSLVPLTFVITQMKAALAMMDDGHALRPIGLRICYH